MNPSILLWEYKQHTPWKHNLSLNVKRFKRIPYRIGVIKNLYISMKFSNNFHFQIVGCLFISAILIIPHALHITEGSGINQQLYPINSKPYGLTYGEWSSKWWQWAMSIPTKDSPIVDKTGAKCAVGQNDPNVWFLAGTGGGEANRVCAIPAGKAIFFPIINVECDYSYPNLKTESDLRKCAKDDQDKVTNLLTTVDGVAIPDLKQYRVQSPLFNMTVPKDNVMGIPPGTAQAVSDGFWVFLRPLPPGKHEIDFTGSLADFTATGPLNLVEDAKYDVTITEP